jgi:hypothetical protein
MTKRMIGSLVLWAASIVPGATLAEPLFYKLPDDVAAFRPGPGIEVAQSNCLSCHSADYINFQPPKKGQAFWEAEVQKNDQGLSRPDQREGCKRNRRLSRRDLLTRICRSPPVADGYVAQENGSRLKASVVRSAALCGLRPGECVEVEAPNMGAIFDSDTRAFDGRLAFSRRRRLAPFSGSIRSSTSYRSLT